MRIGVDMGHSLSGAGTGAVGIKKEVDMNRLAGKRLIQMLQEKGHFVVNCTIDSASSTNAQLSGIIAKEKAQALDYFISLHLNSYESSAHGVETYICSGSWKGKEEVRSFAKRINDELANKIGWYNRGIKEANYRVLKETNSKAILVELGFCSNQGDMNKWDTEKIAKALFKGITGSDYVTTPQNTNNGVPSDFNAIQYLLNYEDVMKAMNSNSSFSAKHHYDNYGRKEGRKYVNDVQYLRDNHDVLKAANDNSSFSAQHHYVNHGKAEGRTYKAINSEYRVKITADVLNVRAGAGTGYKVTTTVKRNEVYTIVETQGNWGKLKSGAGWICLDYTIRC